MRPIDLVQNIPFMCRHLFTCGSRLSRTTQQVVETDPCACSIMNSYPECDGGGKERLLAVMRLDHD